MAETLGEAAEKFVRSDDAWIDDTYSAHEQSYLAGAAWMRKQFTLHGTDGCRDCETGRATMYVTLEGRCLECDHRRDRPDSHASEGEGK